MLSTKSSFFIILLTCLSLISCKSTTTEKNAATASKPLTKGQTPTSQSSSATKSKTEIREKTTALQTSSADDLPYKKQFYSVQTRRIMSLLNRGSYAKPASIDNFSQRIAINLAKDIDPAGELITIEYLKSFENSPSIRQQMSDDGDLTNIQNMLETITNRAITRLNEIAVMQTKSDIQQTINTTNIDLPLKNFGDFSVYWETRFHHDLNVIAGSGVSQKNAERFLKSQIQIRVNTLSNLSFTSKYSLMMNAVLKALDPHSNYFLPEVLSALNDSPASLDLANKKEQLSSNFGLSVSEYLGRNTVSLIHPNSPAEQAGIKAGSEVFLADSISPVSTSEISQKQKVFFRDPKTQLLQEPVELNSDVFSSYDYRVSSSVVVVPNDEGKMGVLRVRSFYNDMNVDAKQ